MPTYNAERYLQRSLESIEATSKSFKYEIIVADGGSNDKTIEILKSYNVSIIQNQKRIAEYGKYLAYKKASGKYIVFIDADNIISSKDWLSKMLAPFTKSPDLIGVESNYKISKDFTSLNTYLAMLVIVDPFARLLSTRPSNRQMDGYIIKRFKKSSSPVSGANGFIWQKKYLDDFLSKHPMKTLEESTILNYLAAERDLEIANVFNVGIYHYYADDLLDYLKKRRKIARKFLSRRKEKITWVDTRMGLLKICAALYLATFIGPLLEAVYNVFRTKRVEWLWHPVICWLTIVVYGFYLVRDKLSYERTTK